MNVFHVFYVKSILWILEVQKLLVLRFWGSKGADPSWGLEVQAVWHPRRKFLIFDFGLPRASLHHVDTPQCDLTKNCSIFRSVEQHM